MYCTYYLHQDSEASTIPRHVCFCVQMSLESEMSHQRFRFLLQSGVWYLSPTLPFVYLVEHVCHPNAWLVTIFNTADFFIWILNNAHWVCCILVFPTFLFSPVSHSPLPPPQSFLVFIQHSNPGHAGPFPVASGHNANPTSPTSASMAGAHAHRGSANPVIAPIELIPSVTNPENLPCLPEIPPIQVCIWEFFFFSKQGADNQDWTIFGKIMKKWLFWVDFPVNHLHLSGAPTKCNTTVHLFP